MKTLYVFCALVSTIWVAYPFKEVFNAHKLDSSKCDTLFDKKMQERIGSSSAFFKYIAKNVKYPIKAKKNQIMGDCVAQFTVDKEGQIKNINITKPLGYDIEEEVVKVLNQTDLHWFKSNKDDDFEFAIQFILEGIKPKNIERYECKNKIIVLAIP